ncbi:MAG TPA: hypothetical protein VK466_12625, partial [Terriglobales bacterium]|nr:hypothetical protein [Terriglobales bacterium]
PVLLRCLQLLGSTAPRLARPPHRVPLGLLLLSRGDLSEDQLQIALEAQHAGPAHKIGEWLQLLQFATEQQVLIALGLQWAMPLLSSPQSGRPGVARFLPAVLRRDLGLVPVRFLESTRELYVATSEKVDYTILTELEHMLDCRILPCLVSERVMSSWLAADRDVQDDVAQHFDRCTNPSEMARIICSYSARLDCEDLRMAHCGSHIWVRLAHRQGAAHLLFRLPEVSADPPVSPLLRAAV